MTSLIADVVSEVFDLAVRIISAAVGIVISVAVFLMHNTIVLPIAVSLIIGLMIYELLKAASCMEFYPASVAAIVYGMSSPLVFGTKAADYSICYQLALVFIVFLTYIMKHKTIKFEQITFILAVSLLVPSAMTCTIKTEAISENHGLALMILGLCGAWIADSGAYFTGTFLGKHKLCPEISPKKTIEGFVGGILITGLVFVGYNYVYSNYVSKVDVEVNYIVSFIAGAVCAVIGTMGDLSASLIKRQCGIKDYGKIMPGHGGMMDRFDSVLFVMPTFYMFLTMFDLYK